MFRPKSGNQQENNFARKGKKEQHSTQEGSMPFQKQKTNAISKYVLKITSDTQESVHFTQMQHTIHFQKLVIVRSFCLNPNPLSILTENLPPNPTLCKLNILCN